MAELSLREYQDKIASLAADERHDEVIAHARHILKAQPKNLRAYEQLGGALFATERWAETVEVLRRMLGVEPQDFLTHSRLAHSYMALDEFERAIWHAERALDQQPNDSDTLSLLRDLYRQHRQEEIERMRMTAGALAQQHIRGNLLGAALDTLDAALDGNPERLDLQLLRARTLWLDGQRMDAAEAANQILERLPYALDANRIMSELWLAERRPTDAQLYLQRIEELDPYLAHRLAAGQPAPDDLLLVDELDIGSLSPSEKAIVDPQWLSERGGEDSGLGALFGIGEADDEQITADLDDLLAAEQSDEQPGSMTTGEAVAEVSEIHFTGLAEPDESDAAQDEPVAQASPAQPPHAESESDAGESLDEELAGLLEQLNDELDDEGEAGDWMAEIQQGSLELEAEDESLDSAQELEGEWVEAPDDDEAGGAPWLSAAMREALDQAEGDELDLFGGDEQLQNLLKATSDTEPIDRSDIEAWLEDESSPESSEADERFVDIEDDEDDSIDEELLQSPPAESWLVDPDDEALADEEENRLNAELIDSWQAELGDDEDDDDDPYVDWLRDEPSQLDDDDFAALDADADDSQSPLSTPPPEPGATDEQARAWGLDDAEQLADFVEPDAQAAGSEDWLNAVVPGLDRESEASGDDESNEYARPGASRGQEFAWVSDIVEEETGEMPALAASEVASPGYYRFSKPPAWLLSMQAEAAGAAEGIKALSLDTDIDALELDDLTFDDYFSFDTPTDKMDVINLDEDTQELSFVGMDWDDYFDLESPTEKTIAISLDDSAAAIDFDELGLDDDDFAFTTDGDSAKPASDADSDLFNDVGLGPEQGVDDETDESPLWLKLDSGDDSNLADDRRGSSTL